MSERLNKPVETPGSITLIHSRSINNPRTDFSNWEPIQTIQQIHQAMTQMPETRTGVVLGSGKKTPEWKMKGWLTLDINPHCSPDFIADANHLESTFSSNSLDFLFAEYLTFDPSGKKGVSHVQLLDQASKVLKPDGRLAIKTTHWENSRSALPNRYEYVLLMAKYGFNTVAKIDASNLSQTTREITQDVTYYGRKVF